MATDVVIVGAGPVGLVCALGLARAGLTVAVIEAEAGIVESPRAMGYHWTVLVGLDRLGLLDAMKAEGLVVPDFTFRVLRTGEQIVFNASVLNGLTDHPYMLILGQNKLARIILDHAERHPNITIHWKTACTGVEQDRDGVAVMTVRNGALESYRAEWLIAADGARSTVRKAVGLGFDGITWPDRFVATNIRFDFERHGWGRMGYLIDPVHGAVVGKLDREGLWRVMFSENAALPIETLEERIHVFLNMILPGDKKYELTLFSGYGTHQRSAERYRVGRVLLAGDAAHATNPTSGFGLVGGLFDAYALTDALAAVIGEGADPAVLDAYSHARRQVFNDITTPVSSGSMRLVFHSEDPDKLEHVLAGLRSRAQDPQQLIKWYQTQAQLETPSLVTGFLR